MASVMPRSGQVASKPHNVVKSWTYGHPKYMCIILSHYQAQLPLKHHAYYGLSLKVKGISEMHAAPSSNIISQNRPFC